MEENEILLIASMCLAIEDFSNDEQIEKPKKLWRSEWLERYENNSLWGTIVQDWKLNKVPLFIKMVRLCPDQFDNLHKMVAPIIRKEDTFFRNAISTEKRLGITLMYMASGEKMFSIASKCVVSESSVSKIIPETLRAIGFVLRKAIKCPSSPNEWLKIAEGFYQKFNYPHCLGAIDGKHITIRKPSNSGSTYYNYKGNFSQVLMAVVDSDYRFLFVDAGTNGRINDASIFNETTFKKKMVENSMGWPSDRFLPGTNCKFPFHIIGDGIFQLSNKLLKPFGAGQCHGVTCNIFNYRLSRARNVVESSFGQLANEFQVFHSEITLQNQEAIQDLVLAACCLHNWKKDYGKDNGQLVPSCDNQVSHELPSQFSATQGVQTRQQLAEYFMNTGAVSWQWNSINLSNEMQRQFF